MRIVIVEDDRLVCTSLKVILQMNAEIEVLDIGNDGADGIALYEKYQPDILLMDIRMKEVTGIEAATTILKKYPKARILFLTTFSDEEYIIKALRIGAKGYLLKQDYDSIEPALKAVYSGQSVFGSEIVTKLPNLMNQNQSFDYEKYDLSAREFAIIELVADGKSNKEIADELFLSEGTVRNYLSNILLKLDLRDRTQVAIFYYRHKNVMGHTT